MDHADHVCAALPVSALHLSVWGCHAHQATMVQARGTTQLDQDLAVWWQPAPIELGPFDSVQDLLTASDITASRLQSHIPDLWRRVRS